MRALRAAVYASGFGLIAWGLILSFFITWFWVAITLGLALIIAAGLAEYIARRSDDCGFDETVFGWAFDVPPGHLHVTPPPMAESLAHKPGVGLFVIEGGNLPVWPNEAGAPE